MTIMILMMLMLMATNCHNDNIDDDDDNDHDGGDDDQDAPGALASSPRLLRPFTGPSLLPGALLLVESLVCQNMRVSKNHLTVGTDGAVGELPGRASSC